MGLKFEDIIKLENPYKEFSNGDALAEHREELEKLNGEQKKDLASRMVLGCPAKDLKDFSRAVEASRVPQNDKNSFHEVLTDALEVKSRIHGLMDEKNLNPHNLLLNNEFNEDLFNNFSGLALNILSENTENIVIRLALTTPSDKRTVVAKNITSVFPGSDFSIALGAAFALRRDVERSLLGDKPGSFFSSRDFNIDLCLQFSPLLHALLAGHEQEIGEKLARETDQTRSVIGKKLEQITPKAHEQNNSFRLIAAAMNNTSKTNATAQAIEEIPVATAVPPLAIPPAEEQPTQETHNLAAVNESHDGMIPVEIESPKEERQSKCSFFKSKQAKATTEAPAKESCCTIF